MKVDMYTRSPLSADSTTADSGSTTAVSTTAIFQKLPKIFDYREFMSCTLSTNSTNTDEMSHLDYEFV